MYRTAASRADRRREQGRPTCTKTSARGRRSSKTQHVRSRTTPRKACSTKGRKRSRTATHPTRNEVLPSFPGSLTHLDLAITPWTGYRTVSARPSSRTPQHTHHPTQRRKRSCCRPLETRLRSHFAGTQSTTHGAHHQRPRSFQPANGSRSKAGEEMDWQKIRMARLLCLNGSIPTHWTMSNTSMTLTVQNHYS